MTIKFCILLLLCWQTAPAKSLFIIPKTIVAGQATAVGNSASASAKEIDVSLMATAEIQKRCPAVEITQDKTKALYVLQLQSGSSVLTTPDGKVLYVSPAKGMGNMAKDMCKWLNAH